MRTSSYKQFDIIRSDDPEIFTEKLNEKMYELRKSWPDVTFSEEGKYLIARISYVQHDRVPEDLGDVYEMIDVSFKCEDCPMFEPIRNKDGSPNLRVKRGKCPFSEYGIVYKDSRACDMLYKKIRSGEVQLCLAESEF